MAQDERYRIIASKKGLCWNNGTILSHSFIYWYHLYLSLDQGLSWSVQYIICRVNDKDSPHCCNKQNIPLVSDHWVNNNIMYWRTSWLVCTWAHKCPGVWGMSYRGGVAGGLSPWASCLYLEQLCPFTTLFQYKYHFLRISWCEKIRKLGSTSLLNDRKILPKSKTGSPRGNWCHKMCFLLKKDSCLKKLNLNALGKDRRSPYCHSSATLL